MKTGQGTEGLGWILVLTMLLAVAPAGMAATPAAVWAGTVTHVSDGDTVWVRPRQGGAPRAIRLDGIDAPELCQRHGEAARAALVALVLGQVVQVRVRAHDGYGRALARVAWRGQDVNAWLVTQGHAWSYRFRGQSGPYARLEAQARNQRRGLFRDAHAQRPHEFRRTHGNCH